jgi:hypothetical protein
LNSPISDPELYPCRSAGQSRVQTTSLSACRIAVRLYSEVNFFTLGAANLIGGGPAVFLFGFYTAVRCTVSVAYTA